MRLRADGISIRRVCADDFQDILSLIHQLPGNVWRWSKETGFTQAFQGLVDGETQEAFVAVLRQRIIGFVSLYYLRVLHHGGMVASIQELVVTEELRGRGVGRALLDFARARAKELRCATVEVASGLPDSGSQTYHAGRDLPPANHLLIT